MTATERLQELRAAERRRENGGGGREPVVTSEAPASRSRAGAGAS